MVNISKGRHWKGGIYESDEEKVNLPNQSAEYGVFSPYMNAGVETSSPSVETSSPSVETSSPSVETSSPSVKTNGSVFDPYYESMRKERDAQYKSDLAALETSRSLQRQEASINNELLKKYLPQLNQMSGLTGLGVSESANIDSLARYQNNLTDIERNYQEGSAELLRNYRTDLNTYAAAERAEQRQDQQNVYSNALNIIGSGVFGTEEDLNNYLNNLNLDDASKAALRNYGIGIINSQKEDTEQNVYSDALKIIGSGVYGTEEDLDNYLNTLTLDDASKDALRNYGIAMINYTKNENTKANQEDAYNNASILILAAESVEEVDDILNNWGKNVSEEQYKNLEALANSKKANLSGSEKTEESTETGSTVVSGTTSSDGSSVSFKIPVTSMNGSESMNVSLSLSIVGAAGDQTVGDGKNNGDVFVSGNTIYYKQNNTVYELTDPNGNTLSSDYSGVLEYLTTGETVKAPTLDEVLGKHNDIVKIEDPDEGVFAYYDKGGNKHSATLTEAPDSLATYFSGLKSFQNAKDGDVVRYNYASSSGRKYDLFVRFNGMYYKVNIKEA